MQIAKTLIRLVDAQTDLSHRWAHRWFCWFCHLLAHIQTRSGITPVKLYPSSLLHENRTFKKQAHMQGTVGGGEGTTLAGQIISKSCRFSWPQNQNFLKIHTPLCKNPFFRTPHFKGLCRSCAHGVDIFHAFCRLFGIISIMKVWHFMARKMILKWTGLYESTLYPYLKSLTILDGNKHNLFSKLMCIGGKQDGQPTSVAVFFGRIFSRARCLGHAMFADSWESFTLQSIGKFSSVLHLQVFAL